MSYVETTMDPSEHRILKQVHIEDAAADETFSMGMRSNPAAFIQRNAVRTRWIDA